VQETVVVRRRSARPIPFQLPLGETALLSELGFISLFVRLERWTNMVYVMFLFDLVGHATGTDFSSIFVSLTFASPRYLERN